MYEIGVSRRLKHSNLNRIKPSNAPKVIRLFPSEEDTLFPLSPLEERSNNDSNESKPWEERDGVILTPDYLVDLMVTEAAERHAELQSVEIPQKTMWLDPACGDGAFILGILRYYKRKWGADFYRRTQLRIIAIDISEEALNRASLNISLYIEKEFQVSLNEVVDLQLLCTDALRLLSNRGTGRFQGEIDIVIGNPPYIRHSKLTNAQKADLQNRFPKLYGRGADFFTYFFGAAIEAMKEGGILCFVTPATYIRNSNGANLRSVLYNHCCLVTYLDLDENKVFENAAVHTAISVLMKSREQAPVRYLHFPDVPAIVNASSTGYTPEYRRLRLNSNGTWHIAPELQPDFARASNLVTLGDIGVSVRSGIRSGAANIFIIDDEKANRFSPEVRREWIKPLVVANDIHRESTAASKWLIWIPNSIEYPHPEIIDYLKPYRDRLEKRAEVKNGSTPWFGLRPCNYASLVAAKGIVTPDITTSPRFGMKRDGELLSDGAFFIASHDNVLRTMLNSTSAEEYFRSTSSSVGSLESRGRFRIKANVLMAFPLPREYVRKGAVYRELEELLSGKNSEQAQTNKAVDELVRRMYREG